MSLKTRIVPNGEPGVTEIFWGPVERTAAWLVGALLTTILGLVSVGLLGVFHMRRELDVISADIEQIDGRVDDVCAEVKAHDEWARGERDRIDARITGETIERLKSGG